MNDADDDIYDAVLPAVARVIMNRARDRRPARHTGSVPGRRYIERDYQAGHVAIYRGYFAASSTYTDKAFKTRFRIPRALFHMILECFESKGILPQLKDATGRKGPSTLQKMTAALRMLAYGSPADAVDEYIRISGSSALVVLKAFCAAMVQCFGSEYLRRPTATDLERIYQFNSRRGFPGLLGSIDCTHFAWVGCPKALHGQYKGKEGVPTLIPEAVATHDLWLWHSFFGAPGTLNDINVLDQSDVLDTLLANSSPVNNVQYTLNKKIRRRGYFLADGIYPTSQCFAKPISAPKTDAEKEYTKWQESQLKDIERAFGVLNKRFGILTTPIRLHKLSDITDMVKTTIILHNMRVKYGGKAISTHSPIEAGGYHTGFARAEHEMAIQLVALYSKETALEFMADLVQHLRDHKTRS